MFKKICFILGLTIFASACSREVYLQPVPCTDCEPCPTCTDLTPECCPELAMQTEIITYEVYEPTPVVSPCQQYQLNGWVAPAPQKRNCHTVCRQQRIVNQ